MTQPVTSKTEGVVETPSFVDMPEEHTGTPMSDETEALPNKTDDFDLTDALKTDDSVSETSEDVFKTTPEGFPYKPYWDYPPARQESWSYDHKLLTHVLVKLWKQGTHDFTGGSIGDNGRVSPPLYRHALCSMGTRTTS